MANPPRREVIDAIEAGSTEIIRRVELYEPSGEPDDELIRWNPEDDRYAEERLIDGSVSVDYSRDERRTLDVTLDNQDGTLRPNADHGLWYDKHIKIFRGIRYATDQRPPPILIMEAPSVQEAYRLRGMLSRLGFTRVEVNLDVERVEQARDYDIVVSHTGATKTVKTRILRALYNSGKHIITTGIQSTGVEIPLISTTSASGSIAWSIRPASYDTPVDGGWGAETGAIGTGRRVTAVAGAARPVATALDGSTLHFTAIVAVSDAGGKWFHLQSPSVTGLEPYGPNFQTLFGNVLYWQWGYEPYRNWEIQMGEFVIDSISDQHWPNTVSVQGRDKWKKLLTSKIVENITFDAGTTAKEIIRAVAANAGIYRVYYPGEDVELERRMSFERFTVRADIIKAITALAEKEIFFDHVGRLIVRDFFDPSFAPNTHEFGTGSNGNLVSFSRSINDSRIFNHIAIISERSKGRPYFGQAFNNEPSSPTNVDRIGMRTEDLTLAGFNSDQHCARYARKRLKRAALESYEMSFESIYYPWIEAGEIATVLDPNRTEDDPTRFLMDTIDYPLGLGPMSATGKRVTFVDDTALGGDLGEL